MNQLRLCTWNINLGEDRDQLIKSMQGPSDFKNLDVMLLQEASVKSMDDAKLIAEKLGKDFVHHQVYVQTPTFKWYSTKRKVKGIPQSSAFIWNKKTFIMKSIDEFLLPPYNNKKMSPYGKAIYHLSSTQQRKCIVIEGMFNGKSIRIYNVHFDVLGPVTKTKQLEEILRDSTNRSIVDTEILAGDFNTYRFLKRPTWKKLNAITKRDGFIELTSDIRWTFADKKIPIKQKLDAIFIKHKLPLHFNSWALDIIGSDHLPVFANIDF